MKVLIGDDHALFRAGLRLQLEQMDENVQILEGSDFTEALRLAEEQDSLDLVLIDLDMPGMGWRDALRKLHDRFQDLPVVVISASDDYRDISEALDIGIAGYIPKSSSGDILIGALKLVFSGGTYLPPALLKKVSSERAPQQPEAGGEIDPESVPVLTPRQQEVLVLLAKGQSNKEIALALGISGATVKIHVRRILSALKAGNRTKAVLEAARLGLIPI